MAIGNAG